MDAAKIDIIESLKYHEDDQLTDWIDYDDKTTKKFSKDVLQFANENPSAIKDYCHSTTPTEFSSLSIIYAALSEYSTDWHEFLFEEIIRVVTLAKEKRINPEFIEVLSDIETEDIYSKDEAMYIKMVDFLISQLHLQNVNAFNIQVLDLLDWFLMDLEEDDAILESKQWTNSILKFANNGNSAVKFKAREVLETMEVVVELSPLSLIDKVKGVFK